MKKGNISESRELSNIPNPSEMMRARHPDLFSDTLTNESPTLAKPVFEYHLETLTSRKQEYEFEHFCRKLAEKEICPNLRVQTGPTGGGDSKVDSETYPVASEIAERQWMGESREGHERWGFAFSAKKDWKPKVKADVASILSTGRDYKRIYFFTNQFASDKERSRLEDSLTKHAGIPVHIVDRSWIVEKVYSNGHLDLAIATLRIEGAGSENLRRAGPRDVARLAELDELDRQVIDVARYQGASYQLIEDCLRSAILARGLERPRDEVESRFLQADRLAQKLDLRPQRMRIAYNRAWTSYWWYNDYSAFNRFYDEVEQLLIGTTQAAEAERLLNLWQLLAPAVAVGRISAQDAKIAPRCDLLIALLQEIAADSARPNNALQARTGLTLIKATRAIQSKTDPQLDAIWIELSQIVDESSNLGGYSVETLCKIVQELGMIFDSPAFDSLYEKVVDVIRNRRSEGEAGKAYSERGGQKLQQNKPYDAIQWFGRAEELLIKEEYRAELVVALAGSSYAYERAGLIWAARNKILAAVSSSLSAMVEDGEITLPALHALQRLAWLELQLGRIPHVLNAMGTAAVIGANLNLTENLQESFRQEVMMQEAVLGIHFLNTPFDVVPALSYFPDVLERLGLTNARLTVLFVLGHEKAIYEEDYFSPDQSMENIQAMFEKWQDQPAAKDITPYPVLFVGETSVLKSTILGSEIALNIQNDPVSLGIAESLLGALEAFLATSNEDDLMPHREHTVIQMKSSDQITGMPTIHFSEEDGAHIEIICPSKLDFSNRTDLENFRNWLQETVVVLLSRIFIIRDLDAWMEKIAGQERAFSRALIFGDVLTLGRNVFNGDQRIRLADWIEPEDKAYKILRDQPWRKPKVKNISSDDPSKAQTGVGPPPSELFDKSNLKHTERKVLSPIDVELWNRAKWHATLFAMSDDSPPFLGLVFQSGETGKAIFSKWREQWGERNTDSVLRVAIITGISKENPAHYAVTIGPNLEQLKDSEQKVFMTVSRINRMEPSSSVNLDRFIKAYQRVGAYFLIPAQSASGEIPPQAFFQLALARQKLEIRPAWQIGENDMDIMALRKDDNPFIPSEITDAPVKAALEQINNNRRQ